MGFSSISPGSLILIIVILLLILGTSRLKSIGKDLADAIKNFQKGMSSKKSEDKDNEKITKKDEKDGN